MNVVDASVRAKHSTRKVGVGLLIVIACAFVTLGAVAFGARMFEEPPPWFMFGGAVLGLLICFAVYRGFRLMTAAGRGASVALTVLGFPVLLGGLLFAIGAVATRADVSGFEEMIASLNPGGDVDPGGDDGPQDSAGGDYFEGLTASNTDVAELDAIIEDW